MLLYPNPRVDLPMDGMDFARLRQAIEDTTGFAYGYLPERMFDTTTMSFTLTCCGRYDGKRKLKKKRGLTSSERILIGSVIRAWALGTGKGMPTVTWPDYPVPRRNSL